MLRSHIRKLPWSGNDEKLLVGGVTLRLPHSSIIVWVSLVAKGSDVFDPDSPRVPALLDTGFNNYFAIREESLRDLAGFDPRHFLRFRSFEQPRGKGDKRAANVWLFPNVPGTRLVGPAQPILLELDEGIMVFHSTERSGAQNSRDLRPRIPLLGLPALRRNKLVLSVDGRNQWANIYRSRLLGLF
jgi:hypothetical protein